MPTYTEAQVPYSGEGVIRPPIKSRPRSWKFRYWGLRNWLNGYAFSSIKRCRSCDHTTPYHYPKCIRGVSRTEFERQLRTASRRGAEVTRFAALMERELSANAYKDSHQLSHDFDHLIEQLREHVKKFAADPTDEYAADVANLAMLARAAAKIDRLQRAASSPAVESSDV